MNINNLFKYKIQEAVSAPWSDRPSSINQNAVDFVPDADEVARRAYFSYVNEGSPEGRDVQHWLEAEEELITERSRTRIHGYHN